MHGPKAPLTSRGPVTIGGDTPVRAIVGRVTLRSNAAAYAYDAVLISFLPSWPEGEEEEEQLSSASRE